MHFSFLQGPEIDLTNLKSTSVVKKSLPTFNIIQQPGGSFSNERNRDFFSFLPDIDCNLKKQTNKNFLRLLMGLEVFHFNFRKSHLYYL